MSITLERAIALAAQAHEGQRDKGGSPYILHPLRVMAMQKTIRGMIVGVLHDVLEDCPEWGPDRLRGEGLSEDLLQALDALTKRPGESYEVFVCRAAAIPLAREVKRANLMDNLDASRLPEITDDDVRRFEKYRTALKVLEGLP
jgi:hypothetical protein